MLYLPRGCKSLRSRSHQIIMQDYFSTDLIEIINNVVKVYFECIKKPKWFAIFKKRFGFDGFQEETYDAIGKEFKVTRERIRQILFIISNQIRMLLEGKEIVKPHIIFKNGSKLFNSFKQHLNCKCISKIKLDKILENYTKSNSESLIKFLMYINDFDVKQYNGKKYFKRNDNLDNVNEKISSFINFLSKQAFFISDSEIKNRLKINQTEFEFYLCFLPDLEIKKSNNETFYRLPFKNVYDLNTCVYRILSEAGKQLHFSKILEILRKTRNIETNCHFVNKDDNIVKIGNTGYWALSEWMINSDSIPVLIEKCLKEENKPLTLTFLFNYINKIRHVNIKTVNSILHMRVYKRKIVQYFDRTFGLKEWKLKIPLSNRKKYFKKKQKENIIIEKAMKILEVRKKILLVELINEIHKKYGFLKIYIYKVVQNNSHLFKVKQIEEKKRKFVCLKGIL